MIVALASCCGRIPPRRRAGVVQHLHALRVPRLCGDDRPVRPAIAAEGIARADDPVGTDQTGGADAQRCGRNPAQCLDQRCLDHGGGDHPTARPGARPPRRRQSRLPRPACPPLASAAGGQGISSTSPVACQARRTRPGAVAGIPPSPRGAVERPNDAAIRIDHGVLDGAAVDVHADGPGAATGGAGPMPRGVRRHSAVFPGRGRRR